MADKEFIFRMPPLPPVRLAPLATIWYEDDDGFQHRRNGRFHHRRNIRHIERCVSIIRQRYAADEEIWTD